VEAKAINICQSGPSLEHVEDLEEDKTPLWICEVEYEPGDRLFMTRILLEPAIENLCATSTISQKLAEGAHQASEMWKRLFPLPDEFTLLSLLWQPRYSLSRRRTAHSGWFKTTEPSIA